MEQSAPEIGKPIEKPKRARISAGTPNNYWIVSKFDYAVYLTLNEAIRDRARMAKLFPEETFRVIRCKRSLRSGGSKMIFRVLVSAIEGLLAPAGTGKPFAERIAQARAALAMANLKPAEPGEIAARTAAGRDEK